MQLDQIEWRYWRSIARGLVRPAVPVTPYIPTTRQLPSRHLKVFSSWSGVSSLIPDILERFQVRTDRCLEFGVERGFSTVALSSYFTSVIGVDTFQGDRHTNFQTDFYEETKARLAPYDNIQLVRSDYQSYILKDKGFYDLIHVDIIHTYADTYNCGIWSAINSQCTLFHDTESFPQVKRAAMEIARKTGKKFYNFDESYGLGILV